MPKIENPKAYTSGHVDRDLRAMDDATLMAQECVQKGALHAIQELLKMGANEANARAFQDSLERFAEKIAAEINRRKAAGAKGISVIDT